MVVERSGRIGRFHYIMYIDDILIAEESEEITDAVKDLRKGYHLKDLGKVRNYLGISI